MSRKRKVPVTVASTSAAAEGRRKRPSSASPEASRAIIRRFHVLLKRKAQLEKAGRPAPSEVAKVHAELEDMGGIEEYQRMSNIGQGEDRGGGSEKIYISWLRARERHKLAAGAPKHRLLEVGALRPDNYAPCAAWIDAEPIDLHARLPGVREQDFLLMDEQAETGQWDLISLSLVLNFVPDAKDRGRMLRMCRSFLKPQGLLFVALPLPCVLNSRYLTLDHFKRLCACVGLHCAEEKWKEGGKMVYFLLERADVAESQGDSAAFGKKRVLVEGPSRNNFCVLL
ncbi:hypothetical protein AURDEDRAFT_142246 [Auricularia subglabra TFB-10046 SS5]|nr:hypothetical protein AURDEDRAFT_142246 [Auricularia subglabra TFB-10046 SS5]